MRYLFNRKEVEAIIKNSQKFGFDAAFTLATKAKTIKVSSLTLEDIAKTVAGYFGLTVEDLKINSRLALLKNARFFYFFFCKVKTRQGIVAIGKQVNKHHSTVLHGHKQIETWIEVNDPVIMEQFQDLENMLSTIEGVKEEKIESEISIKLN
jgi:chromosomal replication initiation ATPase DnaA